jgi:hypothetical protein
MGLLYHAVTAKRRLMKLLYGIVERETRTWSFGRKRTQRRGRAPSDSPGRGV